MSTESTNQLPKIWRSEFRFENLKIVMGNNFWKKQENGWRRWRKSRKTCQMPDTHPNLHAESRTQLELNGKQITFTATYKPVRPKFFFPYLSIHCLTGSSLESDADSFSDYVSRNEDVRKTRSANKMKQKKIFTSNLKYRQPAKPVPGISIPFHSFFFFFFLLIFISTFCVTRNYGRSFAWRERTSEGETLYIWSYFSEEGKHRANIDIMAYIVHSMRNRMLPFATILANSLCNSLYAAKRETFSMFKMDTLYKTEEEEDIRVLHPGYILATVYKK